MTSSPVPSYKYKSSINQPKSPIQHPMQKSCPALLTQCCKTDIAGFDRLIEQHFLFLLVIFKKYLSRPVHPSFTIQADTNRIILDITIRSVLPGKE